MSRIDDLIAEHCPDGVSFQMLGDVTTKAVGIKWSTLDAAEERRYIDLSSVDRVTKQIGETIAVTASNAPSRARQIVKTDDVIFATTRPTQMRWALITPEYEDQIASTGYCVLRPRTELILPAFLAHVLGAKSFQYYVEANQIEGNYPSIPDNRVRAFKLPVPPIEVQRAIVEVLDTFSKLEARKQQYEYYRTTLMLEREGAETALLGDIATVGTGSHDTKDAQENGNYTFYARGRVPLKLDTFDFDEEAIITAGDGVGVGKVFHFARGKYALHQRAYRIVPQPGVDARYIYHYLLADFSRYLERTSVHASVTSLRRPMFLKYSLQLPPLEEQRRIVAILDKFDALVNDLSIGLPAELAARRQQYEYYRDKLLTFKELEAAA